MSGTDVGLAMVRALLEHIWPRGLLVGLCLLICVLKLPAMLVLALIFSLVGGLVLLIAAGERSRGLPAHVSARPRLISPLNLSDLSLDRFPFQQYQPQAMAFQHAAHFPAVHPQPIHLRDGFQRHVSPLRAGVLA
jgi:hypothetical protein